MTTQIPEWAASWNPDVQCVVCENCDSSFLLPAHEEAPYCPLCHRDQLDPVGEGSENLAYTQTPELTVPFRLEQQAVIHRVMAFSKQIPFAPRDLEPGKVVGRLQRVFMPMWLVDGDTGALWQAEMGFNYQIVSHQDRLSGGRWMTKETQDTRTRWEPRVGRLARRYDNVPAPALEDYAQWQKRLGRFDLDKSTAYQPEQLGESFVRLPGRSPEDAWQDAKLSFQRGAGEECREASGADAVRNFRWDPSFDALNWTLLLLPVFTTYYLDDDNVPRMVYVNGQTGSVWGEKRASMKRAQQQTLIFGGAALIVFVLSLLALAAGFVIPPLAVFGIIGLAGGFIGGLFSLYPMIQASRFNKRKS